jgi:hypothetical protein
VSERTQSTPPPVRLIKTFSLQGPCSGSTMAQTLENQKEAQRSRCVPPSPTHPQEVAIWPGLALGTQQDFISCRPQRDEVVGQIQST